MNDVFGVGIIGCGLIGQKRAKALGSGGRLVACADIDVSRADSLAKSTGAKVFRDWRELVWLRCVDVVIVATLHDSLAEITLTAIDAGKHVLVEKPAARTAAEPFASLSVPVSTSQTRSPPAAWTPSSPQQL